MNTTCNSTLEDLGISEVPIVGPLRFHDLAIIIGGGCAAFAILMSMYLIWQHARYYSKPQEQKHIIRILFMVPIYSASAFLCIWYFRHAVYYQVMSDCYEAFAISSFFALLCHYVAPDLHDQKQYFRQMQPIKPWVMPINWLAKCCGGERGAWRTPKSGLTWFNIIWIGIYHYCFIRVTMTITAVVTEYYGRYCESSDSPVFAHIWILIIESVAVSIAMYCVIQFYIQLREPLAEHKPFLKVLAIKLVIFLSFWQTSAISVGTSTLHIISANAKLAYQDIAVGIPSLLLCFEMALFSVLHLWAFPYGPYLPNAKQTFYPLSDPSAGGAPRGNQHETPRGPWKALANALNMWDVMKAFGRGMRWLFVGAKKRHQDPSYQNKTDLDTSYPMKAYPLSPGVKSTDGLQDPFAATNQKVNSEESAGLIDHAQGFSALSPPSSSPFSDPPQGTYYEEPSTYAGPTVTVPPSNAGPFHDPPRGPYRDGPSSYDIQNAAVSPIPANQPYQPYQPYSPNSGDLGETSMYRQGTSTGGGGYRQDSRTSAQVKVGNALWGHGPSPGQAM